MNEWVVVVQQMVFQLVDATNRFIDTTEPFKLAKDETQRQRLGTILYTCAEAVRILLLYLRPFMPETVDRGLARIGWADAEAPLAESGGWGLLAPGTQTVKGDGLFPRKV